MTDGTEVNVARVELVVVEDTGSEVEVDSALVASELVLTMTLAEGC